MRKKKSSRLKKKKKKTTSEPGKEVEAFKFKCATES